MRPICGFRVQIRIGNDSLNTMYMELNEWRMVVFRIKNPFQTYSDDGSDVDELCV